MPTETSNVSHNLQSHAVISITRICYADHNTSYGSDNALRFVVSKQADNDYLSPLTYIGLPRFVGRTAAGGLAVESLYQLDVIYRVSYILSMQVQRSLDATLAALSDPTRRAMLARLAKGEATVNELAEPFTISQPAISRHIKVLAEAGLIVQRIEGSKRPCRLAADALSELDEYLEMLRRGLEQNYQRLDRLLAKQQTRKGQEHR